MNTILKTSVVFLLLIVGINYLYSQEKTNIIKERYVEINDIDTFFTFSDSQISDTKCFELYNIYEDESSKPVFIDVSDLNNVVKFSIKSGSTNYENQRTCYLRVNKTNHLNTLRLVLIKMKVKYIKINQQFIEIDKFFSKIL